MNTTTDSSASVLRTLRDLVPQRRLTTDVSLRLAELQANRLLELVNVAGPVVPDDVITDLPKIEVRYESEIPVSGSAHWELGKWVITLRASEPPARQRFSMMHEFKHIIDHESRYLLYGDVDHDPKAIEKAERAADQFAACLLMPKRWLKMQWFASGQQVQLLATRLGVSPRALEVRLWHLGLPVERPRCPTTSEPSRVNHTVRRYLRYTPLVEVTA
jgi:hypothetical protein